jgi:hypothetical protein
MGGGLKEASAGKVPTFLLAALKDRDLHPKLAMRPPITH